jgi:peptidoglycan hydrolase-like protein with peptidoglycan-binding domain
METKKAFGCLESEKDPRTVLHSSLVETLATPLIKGGFNYLPTDILDQKNVGICTAISHIQNRNKANGKTYSADFQYLLQKKFYDMNWTEGSSILNSLKVGVKYGYLPENLWTYTTLADRELPYSQYIKKLQAITDDQINALLAQCVDKILGYASVQLDPQSIAQAIMASQTGVLCRYSCGESWYTGKNGVISWQPKDIDPIQPSVLDTDGHAIGMFSFDYTLNLDQKLCNTWGTLWDIEGTANIIFNVYPPTEVWTILQTIPPVQPYVFVPTIKFLQIGLPVRMLQQKLGIGADGIFGLKTLNAVKAFQSTHGLISDGIVGIKTCGVLNNL